MEETFSAPDISCEHCKKAVEGALNPIEGVERAVVDIPSKTVTINYDPRVAPKEQLFRAMEEEGYPVLN